MSDSMCANCRRELEECDCEVCTAISKRAVVLSVLSSPGTLLSIMNALTPALESLFVALDRIKDKEQITYLLCDEPIIVKEGE